MTKIKLNQMARRVHKAHIKWWQDIDTGKPIYRSHSELMMLVVTELAEAAEGIRKNLMDDKLPHRTMEEVEMADAYIRLMDYAGGFKMELERYEPASEFHYSNRLSELYWITMGTGIEKQSVCLTLASIEQYCKRHGLDLFGAIEEKLEFNAKRKDHTHAARRGKHGKKF